MQKHEFHFSNQYLSPNFDKDLLIALNDSITATEKDIFQKQTAGSKTDGYWPMLLDIRGTAAVWTLARVH